MTRQQNEFYPAAKLRGTDTSRQSHLAAATPPFAPCRLLARYGQLAVFYLALLLTNKNVGPSGARIHEMTPFLFVVSPLARRRIYGRCY